MSDPYTEATRHERRGPPTFAKVVLVAGGLFAATLVAVAVVGAVFARKAVLEADLETMEFETTTTETFANMAETVFGSDVTVVGSDFEQGTITLRAVGGGGDFDIDLADLGEWLSEVEAIIEQGIEEGIRIEGETDESREWITLSRRNGRTILDLRGNERGGVLTPGASTTGTRTTSRGRGWGRPSPAGAGNTGGSGGRSTGGATASPGTESSSSWSGRTTKGKHRSF